jgi:hypothetical protein
MLKIKECGMRKNGLLVVAVLFCLLAPGCASTQKTVKTETTESYQKEMAPDEEVRNTGIVEKSETTSTTTEAKAAGHPGILSSTVHAIGWVIALPFRLVGGLLRIIF